MQAITHYPRFSLAAILFCLFLGLLVTGCDRLGNAEPTPPPAAVATEPPPATETAVPTATLVPPTGTPLPPPTPTVVSGSASIGDPFIPELGNTGYDVLTYTLDLAIDPPAGTLDGTVTIAAVSTLDDLGRLSLDFAGFEIEQVQVNGVPAGYAREGRKLFVDIPAPFPDTDIPFNVAVTYRGQPLRENSAYIRYADYLGITFLENNTFYALSEPDGARYWYPANDHPLDKAAYHINLTVPRGLAAISNGELIASTLSTMPDGGEAATFFWQHNEPMAPYLALVAAGHYLRVDDVSPNGVPLVYYYFPEFEEDYLEATAITPEAMDWMSELFGPYPFESYGQATYYAMGVSMETQTMTLLSYQMLNERTVIHELAHAWFGDWVSPESWADVWRNEGLATYTELLWLERQEPGALEREISNIEAEVAERAQIYPLDDPPPERLFAFEAYNRSTLLIHDLRQEIGDEAFFTGLRLYVERYGGSTANHDEFQAVMEEVSGRSLDDFFAPWLE